MERLVNVDSAINVLNQLRYATTCHSIREVEEHVLDALLSVGFTSARLYYLDDSKSLRFHRERSRAHDAIFNVARDPFSLPLHDTNHSAYLSYKVLTCSHPLVIHIDHGNQCATQPLWSATGIATLTGTAAYFESLFSRLHPYEWIDVPLIYENVPFGKITLEHASGAEPIKPHEFNLLMLLMAPIAMIISSVGWYGAYKLPEDIVHTFWKEFDTIRTVDELFHTFVSRIRVIFNARDASLFWVLAPKSAQLAQPPKLVLVASTYAALKPHLYQPYYLSNEGLTGKVWRTGQYVYEEDVSKCPEWLGKVKDSPGQFAYVGAPVLSKGDPGTVVGVLRIPEGHDHRLIKREAMLLQLFGSTVIAPAFEAFITLATARASQLVVETYLQYMKSILPQEDDSVSSFVWEFIEVACKKVIDREGKHVIVYSVSGDKLTIEKCFGDLIRNPLYQQVKVIAKEMGSTAGAVAERGEPILITDVTIAVEKQMYMPLMNGVQMHGPRA